MYAGQMRALFRIRPGMCHRQWSPGASSTGKNWILQICSYYCCVVPLLLAIRYFLLGIYWPSRYKCDNVLVWSSFTFLHRYIVGVSYFLSRENISFPRETLFIKKNIKERWSITHPHRLTTVAYPPSFLNMVVKKSVHIGILRNPCFARKNFWTGKKRNKSFSY